MSKTILQCNCLDIKSSITYYNYMCLSEDNAIVIVYYNNYFLNSYYLYYIMVV